jgi:hypothetical protein
MFQDAAIQSCDFQISQRRIGFKSDVNFIEIKKLKTFENCKSDEEKSGLFKEILEECCKPTNWSASASQVFQFLSVFLVFDRIMFVGAIAKQII